MSEEEIIKKLQKQEEEMVKKYGYVVHLVAEAANYHTHYLMESFGHPELEIRLNIDPQVAAHFLNKLGERVVAGEKFTDKQILKDFFNPGFDGLLVKSSHGLRLIVPDEAGCLDKDEMNSVFAVQFEMLDEAVVH